MTDIEFAMRYSLLAAGYKPIEENPLPLPFPGLLDELVRYTETPEYRELIKKEREQIKSQQ